MRQDAALTESIPTPFSHSIMTEKLFVGLKTGSRETNLTLPFNHLGKSLQNKKERKNSLLQDSQLIVWAFCLLIIGGTFYADLSIPLGVACAIPYILAVLIASFLQPLWAVPAVILVCSILTIAGIFYSPQPHVVPIWKVFANRGLALFAMWVIAILLYHRNALMARREEALTRIQLLEGLLPICAECKKIRDQADTWHRLETYLSAHSSVTFTHGICPECEQQAMAKFKREQPVQ
jgi:hypothetical protein